MLRAILIDDEPNNLDNLSGLLGKYCPQVEIAGRATDAAAARGLIATVNPNLLFLDIQMPGENGFQLLQSLSHISFDVIFITAYDQYGIQAIKMSALDYLLKPIDIEELKQAVFKAEQQQFNKQQQELLHNLLQYSGNEKNKAKWKLALPVGSEVLFVTAQDIIHCESSNSYTTFFLTGNKKIMVSRPIKEYEDLLGDYGFIRVHQSHLVNNEYIQSLSKKEGYTLLLKDGTQVPVSRQKRDVVLKMLKLL